MSQNDRLESKLQRVLFLQVKKAGRRIGLKRHVSSGFGLSITRYFLSGAGKAHCFATFFKMHLFRGMNRLPDIVLDCAGSGLRLHKAKALKGRGFYNNRVE